MTADKTTLTLGDLNISLQDTDEHFNYSLSQDTADGVSFVTLTLEADSPKTPPNLSIQWDFKAIDTLCMWRSNSYSSHGLFPDWSGSPLESRATVNAPVICLHGIDGTNSITFAADDALQPVKFRAGVVEESGVYDCAVLPFEGVRQANTQFSVTLRIDTRPVKFYETLRDTADWWETFEGYEPLPVPEAARQPMYSTWYSYHQTLTSAEIEAECKIAKDLGCDAVIVDDGWQTNDSNRGYAYTGDWEPERLTDIKESVARIQAMGMKYLLWYSVPFIGYKSKIFKRFEEKVLYHNERLNCAVLDPRYPDVREYIINTYVTAINEWNLDGFKLDFVDAFRVDESNMQKPSDDCDFACAFQAADQLMKDIADRLSAINPDILLEFRQGYIGPKMRRYGNMFRAGDCPLDVINNRVRTLDIRMLCGSTAAHADMVMWHEEDSVENAALQLINVLYSVPQVSVKLEKVPEHHVTMIKHYLKFWRDNRDVLLDGELQCTHPENMYASACATIDSKAILAQYTTSLATMPEKQRATTHVVNGTGSHGLVLRGLDGYSGTVQITDCQGNLVTKFPLAVGDIHAFDVPKAGIVTILL